MHIIRNTHTYISVDTGAPSHILNTSEKAGLAAELTEISKS